MAEAQAAQHQLIQQFLNTCQQITLLNASSNRGMLNKLVTDYAERIVEVEEFQEVVNQINRARDRGEDRICLLETQIKAIYQVFEERSFPSSRIWLSMLTTLGYAVMEYKYPGHSTEITIAW